MMWAFHTHPDPEKDPLEHPILPGVTLYLPEKGVVLAIETKDKHEEITKNMQERHYLKNPSPEGSDKNQQPSNKSWDATGDKPAN